MATPEWTRAQTCNIDIDVINIDSLHIAAEETVLYVPKVTNAQLSIIHVTAMNLYYTTTELAFASYSLMSTC